MAAVNVLLIGLGLLLLLGLIWILTHRRPSVCYGRRQMPPQPEHGFTSPKPDWVREEIIRLKAQGTELGCRSIGNPPIISGSQK